MKTLIVAGLIMLNSSAAAQPDPARVRWLKDTAVPFEFDDAGHGFDDLRALPAMIGDARVVSLGEPTHGTRECFQFKHRLVEYLVTELGFSVFSIEASMPESCRLTDYVLKGEGDPRALIRGMYFWTWDTEEVLAMVEWMRKFNAEQAAQQTGKRVIFTGFDMQEHRVAAALARDFVARADPGFAGECAKIIGELDAATSAREDASSCIIVGEFPVELVRGKRLVLSGAIRTAALNGFAGLWCRVDGPKGETLAFDNMQSQAVRGDTEWRRYQIGLDVPANASTVVFGALCVGKGVAWFDSLAIEFGGAGFLSPDDFDLDMEGPALKGFTPTTPTARIAFDADRPNTGDRSLRLSTSGPTNRAGRITMDGARLRAEELLEHLEANAARYLENLAPSDVAWGIQNARVVAQCFRSNALQEAGNDKHVDTWGRDAAMAANVTWLADQHPGEKLILWAHNGHVGRRRYAMGHYLDQRIGASHVTVGFATGTGTYSAIGDQGLAVHPLQAPTPSSIEGYLMATDSPRLFLDLRTCDQAPDAALWIRRPIEFRMIGAVAMTKQLFPQPVAEMFDILVWQRETTAARPLWQVVRRR